MQSAGVMLVFPQFLKTFSERQILWSLCSVDFHALTLKLPIQTLLPAAPKLKVHTRPGKKCPNFRKMSTCQVGYSTFCHFPPTYLSKCYLKSKCIKNIFLYF